MNHVMLIGRLTRDPELRHTNSGSAVASFAIAVDHRASQETHTDFIDIVAWKGTAEFVSRYFNKGQMIAVHGRLQIREWTDKDGNKRKSAEVVADNVYFTESKKSRTESTEPAQAEFEGITTQAEFEDITDDGELPF